MILPKKLDFKDIKFPCKVREIHKIKNKLPPVSVLLVMKIRKNMQFIYQKNAVKKKHFDLLLVEEKGKRHYVLIKDFNTSMYNDTLNGRRKIFFCRLQAFSTQEILKCHIKECFKINDKQNI